MGSRIVLRSSCVAPAQSPLLSEWGEPGYSEAGACQVVCCPYLRRWTSQAESSASEIVLVAPLQHLNGPDAVEVHSPCPPLG